MRVELQTISHFIKLSLFVLIFLLKNGSVWAQERVVSGTVFDENQEVLPGVNIVLKGTTIGTISDYNGVYRLNLPEEGGVLLMSAIGYSTKEIPIGSRSIIDHVMAVSYTHLTLPTKRIV